MKEVNKAFYDHSIKMAIAYENKESSAREIGSHSDAVNFQRLAHHHRKEASKYLSEIEV